MTAKLRSLTVVIELDPCPCTSWTEQAGFEEDAAHLAAGHYEFYWIQVKATIKLDPPQPLPFGQDVRIMTVESGGVGSCCILVDTQQHVAEGWEYLKSTARDEEFAEVAGILAQELIKVPRKLLDRALSEPNCTQWV
jgi:hypothetical protein